VKENPVIKVMNKYQSNVNPDLGLKGRDTLK
jgi:hypothetical protein